MYSRSQPASTHSTAHDATVGERSRKQKISDYDQPRIAMETAYKVWSFSLPTRSAAEVESMTIGGADPRS